MNLSSKFKVLQFLSVILLIVNYLFAVKTVSNTLVLVASVIVIIAYGTYQSKHAFDVNAGMITDLDNKSKDAFNKYLNVKKNATDDASTSNSEMDKVDEITTALENTSMMVIRNKENTRQAAQLTQDVIKAINNGNEEMSQMLDSINEIKNLSNEIQKIVKVIDDIAFQTNILALNAAVEAARAGDAGKGFAVVADEVRSLAQKSAEAVNNTSKIIEKNIVSAENGVNISVRVDSALNKMSEEIAKVEELINEITASSEEQATEVIRTKDIAKELDNIVELSSNSKMIASKEINELSNKLEDIDKVISNLKNGVKDVTVDDYEFKSEVKKETKKEEVKVNDTKEVFKSSTSNFTDKEYKALSNAPKAEVKKVEPEKVLDLDDDDDDIFSPASSDAEESPKDDADNGFNQEAFNEAKMSSVSNRKIAKSNAEAILPLDDSDGF